MLYKYNESMCDECVDIFCDVYTSKEFNFDFLTKESVSDYFHEIANDAYFRGFVYVQNKQIVGVCLGKKKIIFGNKMYEITEICVKNDLRGRGIGKRFLNDIENIIKKEEYICINLNTKKTINAYEFYLKNGFVEKQDVVQLTKTL